MKIESKTEIIRQKNDNIFNFLTDFTNFSLLIPDKIEDWKATKETCSFKISGIGTVGIRIFEKTPYSLIIYTNSEEGSLPLQFKFWFNLQENMDNQTVTTAFFEMDVNMVMAAMLKPQVKKFLDIMIDTLKIKMEI